VLNQTIHLSATLGFSFLEIGNFLRATYEGVRDIYIYFIVNVYQLPWSRSDMYVIFRTKYCCLYFSISLITFCWIEWSNLSTRTQFFLGSKLNTAGVLYFETLHKIQNLRECRNSWSINKYRLYRALLRMEYFSIKLFFFNFK